LNQISDKSARFFEASTCNNKRTMMRDELEHMVLDGLQNHLMDDELFEVFCEAYTARLNDLRMEKNASLIAAREELARIDREQDKLVDAIIDGLPASKVKGRMIELEARQHELEAFIANTHEEPVLLHPNMSAIYRDKVGKLVEALRDEKRRHEAVDLIRGLIDQINLTPVDEDGKASLAVEIQGALAGILSLATESKRPLDESDLNESTKLVAGAGFEPTTFRL